MEHERFGRLVVLSKHGNDWKCQCDCGTVKTVSRYAVLRAPPKNLLSCGCLQREAAATIGRTRNRRHGYKGTTTYRTWGSMRNRCQNPNNVAYSKYGGRGIEVCERWAMFENFLADMGERPDGKTLDRIDNNGPYSPENCQWATAQTQARNTRSNVIVNLGGMRMTLKEAAERTAIDYKTLLKRVAAGWAIERALHQPIDSSKRPFSRTARLR